METTPRREARSDELRRNLRPLLNAIEREHTHVTIKRYDEATAVIVPIDWYKRAQSVLAAYADEGMSGDAPMSAQAVRIHVTTLAGLLGGMRKIAFTPEGEFREYWEDLQAELVKLADLLPENVND